MVVWKPEGSYLRPGYWVGLDHRARRVVWAIRGTRFMVDLLTDLCSLHPVGEEVRGAVGAAGQSQPTSLPRASLE